MAGKIMEVKEQLDKSLSDRSKPWTAILDQIERQTGINRTYLFLGFAGFIGLWLVFGFAAQLVCNLVGVAYPAYVSIKAIESSKKDDDTKWLTYWVVFAVFSLLEYFSDTIVGWFPLYWLVKCIFFVWLMIPTELNGSIIIYKKLIRPYFLKHQSSVDDAIGKVATAASKLLDNKNQ